MLHKSLFLGSQESTVNIMMSGTGVKETQTHKRKRDCSVWSVNTDFSPYMSVHSRQGETPHLAAEKDLPCDGAALLTRWHMSESLPPPSPRPLPPPLSLFYLSAPIASSGLCQQSQRCLLSQARRTVDASIHKVQSESCESVCCAVLDLTSQMKRNDPCLVSVCQCFDGDRWSSIVARELMPAVCIQKCPL